jgi:tetratricopeptide (TPR) repeat protein
MNEPALERKLNSLRRKAWTFVDTHRPREAVEQIEEALALAPTQPQLHLDRVDILLRANRLPDAERACASSRAALGTRADLEVLAARVLRRMGRDDDALAALERGLAAEPGHAPSLTAYGNALAERERFDEALAAFDRLVMVKPRSAEGHLCQGLALARLGRAAEGIEAIERAIDLDGRLLEAYLHRARILLREGRLDEARDAADLAVRKTPKYVEGYLIAAEVALALDDDDAASDHLAKAEALDKLDADVWRLKGEVHARAGRDVVAHVCRGVELYCRDRYEEALAELNAACRQAPDLFHAWHRRGAVLETLGRHDEARADYERAVETSARDPRTLLSLGLLLVNGLDDRTGGLPLLKEAVSADPDAWHALPKELQPWVNRPQYW